MLLADKIEVITVVPIITDGQMSNERSTISMMITHGVMNESIAINLIITEGQMTNGQIGEAATIDGPIKNRPASLKSFRLPRVI